ncbi:MAG: RadC family protein [Candidatus Limivicinus sp.]
MSVHDGHRERLKSRFLEHGIDSFNDLNALELLLFYAIPRRDTNVIAHALLDRFGGLSGVFDASIPELTDVPGIGENTALLIKLVPQMMKKCELSKVSDMRSFRKSSQVAQYLIPRFMGEREEMVLLLCLDDRNNMLCCEVLNRGVVNAVDISVRRLVETALKHKASAVVLSHNHPNGVAAPSREDEVFTEKAQDALRLIGIRMTDHIIISDKNYFSMRESGFYRGFS